MKKLLFLLSFLFSSVGLSAQDVFTLVYANSDDGFVNVRAQPSSKAKILKELHFVFEGLGEGVLIEKGDKWCKVKVGDVVGWAYSKYLGFQTWYEGTGDSILVANSPNTPIFEDAEVDDGPLRIAEVKKGTIIADKFEDNVQYYEEYYALPGYTYLLVRKEDVKIIIKQENR